MSVAVPIFKGKGDAISCWAYRVVKLLEHAMKIVEKVLEGRLWHMVKVDEMQFGFMPGKGTIDVTSVYYEDIRRGILRQGKVVYVLC